MPCRVLFVTWDGPQVSYLESLFVPIFERLGDLGVHFDVLQFRWGEPALTIRTSQRCREAGIGYRAVIVRRGLPVVGPFVTALLGCREVRLAVRDFGSDLVMPRSLLPALAVLAAGGSRLRPMIYDADGLEADERVDFRGLSASSPVYRLLRMVERRVVADSRSVLVRSADAAAILAKRASVDQERFHLVTNGRDPALFHPATLEQRRSARAELGLSADAPVLVYAGSVGPKYRFSVLIRFAQALLLRRADTRLLVLTGSPDAATAELSVTNPKLLEATTIMCVPPNNVARYLGAADVGLAFPAVTFSTRAVVATKIAEYLLCGIPVIGTTAVGDTRAALGAGVFFGEEAGPDAAAEWILKIVLPNREMLTERARTVGLERFSLDKSVRDYRDAIAAKKAKSGRPRVARETALYGNRPA